MAKAIWGLDFGHWSLKVARGRYDKKSDSVIIDLLDEIVYGQLRCGYEASPIEKHREGIIAFRAKHEIGAGDDLCIAVSGSEVFHRFVRLPPVPGRLDDIMRFEAGQQIPFDLEEVVYSYQRIQEETEGEEEFEEIEVGLFALKRQKVAELMDMLGEWRWNLRVIQDAPLAVYNLLHYEGLANESLVVLDVGGATTDVLVLNPPRFWVRTLLVAGDDLTNAFVQHFNVTVEESERIKRRAGRSAHKEQIVRILQPVFEELTTEIQRSLGYYKSLERGVMFDRVLIVGGALRMSGLAQTLSAEMQYKVQHLGELRRIRGEGSVDAERLRTALPGACAALGLVVQGAGQGRMEINMVPEEVVMARVVAQKKPWALASAVMFLLVVAFLVLGEWLYAGELRQADRQVRGDTLETVTKLENDYTQATDEAAELENKLASLADAGIDRDIFLLVLPVFADVIASKDVYVTRLDFSWMEPSAIALQVEALAGDRGVVPGAPPFGGGGLVGPPAPGGAVGARLPGVGVGARPPMPGLPGAGPLAAGGPAARRAYTGQYGDQSLLVLQFSCESTQRSLTYIEGVLEALAGASLPDSSEPAFTEVKMLGEAYDVWRIGSTGAVTSEGQEGAVPYAAFEGFAVVNTGQGTEEVESE